MTLTRRLLPAEAAIYRPAAEAWFAASCERERSVTSVTLFVETANGAPFTLSERLTLRG